jgi:hypothetical protein
VTPIIRTSPGYGVVTGGVTCDVGKLAVVIIICNVTLLLTSVVSAVCGMSLVRCIVVVDILDVLSAAVVLGLNTLHLLAIMLNSV